MRQFVIAALLLVSTESGASPRSGSSSIDLSVAKAGARCDAARVVARDLLFLLDWMDQTPYLEGNEIALVLLLWSPDEDPRLLTSDARYLIRAGEECALQPESGFRAGHSMRMTLVAGVPKSRKGAYLVLAANRIAPATFRFSWELNRSLAGKTPDGVGPIVTTGGWAAPTIVIDLKIATDGIETLRSAVEGIRYDSRRDRVPNRR